MNETSSPVWGLGWKATLPEGSCLVSHEQEVSFKRIDESINISPENMNKVEKIQISLHRPVHLDMFIGTRRE